MMGIGSQECFSSGFLLLKIIGKRVQIPSDPVTVIREQLRIDVIVGYAIKVHEKARSRVISGKPGNQLLIEGGKSFRHAARNISITPGGNLL